MKSRILILKALKVNMKFRIVGIAIIIAALLTPLIAPASQRGLAIEPQSGTAGPWGSYHALIIGINDYAKWPRLQTAVKDATVIKETLITRYGFKADNVILRTDHQASRLQIIADLRYLAQSMGKHDNLFVYYAGHGQLDDFTGDGYWVPAEGALKNPGTWVANSYIKAVLSSEKLQAKNVVVIADSCYSGSMLRGGPSLMSLNDRRYKEKLAQKASLRSRQVISSGGVEPVADGGAEGHSLFAYYLIDALRKNDREVIDLENLFHTRVWTKVTEIGDQRPNVGRLKTPMDQDGQFVLYNAAWAAEHARKHAVLEAERQQQALARQQTAVAQAELELQRQRFEMEKQKLALEKEQLAQQKAIELEKLKLQQQKQEIEYTKLQAQLQAMERKREIAEKTAAATGLQASLAPQTTDSRRAARSSYQLAIFPPNIYTGEASLEGWLKSVESNALAGIVDTLDRDGRVALKYSYQAADGIPMELTQPRIFEQKDSPKLWKRKNMFSKLKPDIKTIREFGHKVGANLIVLVDIDAGLSIKENCTVFLYDTENDKIYEKKARGTHYTAGGVVGDLLWVMLRDYFGNR